MVNRSGPYPWRRWKVALHRGIGGRTRSGRARGRTGVGPWRRGTTLRGGTRRRQRQGRVPGRATGRVRSRILGRVVGRRRVRCSTPCRPARRRSHPGLPVAIWLALDGRRHSDWRRRAPNGKGSWELWTSRSDGDNSLHETPLRRFLSVLCGSVETRRPPLARGRGTLGESAIAAPDAGRPPPGGIGEGRRRFSSGGSS